MSSMPTTSGPAGAHDAASPDGAGPRGVHAPAVPARPRPAGRGARTRQRLIEAAETVFAELGYRDASIVRIVERAGVAQGTFYIYFRSKLEIFETVVDDLNSKMRRAMAMASAGSPSRLEAERRGFAAFFRFTSEHPALYRVIREAEFVAPAASRRHYDRVVTGYATALEAAMAGGEVEPCDPTVLGWALMAVGQLVGQRWVVWEGNQSIPEDVFDQCMTVVRRMLGSPAPAP